MGFKFAGGTRRGFKSRSLTRLKGRSTEQKVEKRLKEIMDGVGSRPTETWGWRCRRCTLRGFVIVERPTSVSLIPMTARKSRRYTIRQR